MYSRSRYLRAATFLHRKSSWIPLATNMLNGVQWQLLIRVRLCSCEHCVVLGSLEAAPLKNISTTILVSRPRPSGCELSSRQCQTNNVRSWFNTIFLKLRSQRIHGPDPLEAAHNPSLQTNRKEIISISSGYRVQNANLWSELLGWFTLADESSNVLSIKGRTLLIERAKLECTTSSDWIFSSAVTKIRL